jgi:penicillin-binding protein 2
MQLAVANASIANGGKIIKPHLLKSISQDKSLVRAAPIDILRADFITPDNLALVRSGMIAAVSDGTACCSIKNQVPVPVAGKTGTAETSSEGFDGKNPRTKPHAWFTSFAPIDNPRVATVVMIENSGEGAEYAVPATREALKWYFQNR